VVLFKNSDLRMLLEREARELAALQRSSRSPQGRELANLIFTQWKRSPRQLRNAFGEGTAFMPPNICASGRPRLRVVRPLDSGLSTGLRSEKSAPPLSQTQPRGQSVCGPSDYLLTSYRSMGTCLLPRVLPATQKHYRVARLGILTASFIRGLGESLRHLG